MRKMELSVLLSLVLIPGISTGLHLSGEKIVESNEIVSSQYRYLTKFAVKSQSEVYMFGNSNPTSTKNDDQKYDSVQLAFVPESVWDQFKYMADSDPHTCSDSVMSVFNGTYLEQCSPYNDQYYIRTLPCEAKCENQPPDVPLLQGSQFSFTMIPKHTEYWFAFLVFCAQNYTFSHDCQWQDSEPINFTYNFSIVNTDPLIEDHPDPFTYQFPYNLHGILISYIVFGFLYIVLVPTHIVLHSRLCNDQEHQIHPMVWLFSMALVLEALNVTFGLLNFSVYASNGEGIHWLSYVAEGWNLLGDWFLILVFILIAGGWQVTRKTVKWKYASFPIWSVYVVMSGLYFIVFIVYEQVQPWDTTIPLQTWAGGVYLACRGLVLFYVWYQLWHIYQQENNDLKLRVYKVFFIFFTFWFWYLLVVVFIAAFVNIVVRRLIVINCNLLVNFLANLLMVALFCPKWSNEYFQFKSYYRSSDPMFHSERARVYHELQSRPASQVFESV